MEIRGTGIGQGVAVGPVVRMAEPLPEPVDRPSHLDPEREGERAKASLSVVAAELANRGAKAGGAAKDVLEAQAMMAEDPSLDRRGHDAPRHRQDRRARGVRGVRRVPRPARRHGRLHGRARRRPRRRLAARHRAPAEAAARPACPNPGHPFVLVARDLAPADTAMLDLDKVLGARHDRRRADLAHRDPRPREVDRRGRRRGGCREPRRRRHGRRRRGRRRRDRRPDAPRSSREAAGAHRRARARSRPRPITPGALADGTPVPLLANLGIGRRRAPRRSRSAPRASGLFRTEFLFLDADSAPSVREQQEHVHAAARGVPRQEGRRARARRRRRQAAGVPQRRARGEPGARAPRHPRAARTPRTSCASSSPRSPQADAATDAELWVMAPMVATVEETALLHDARAGLGIRTAGVMVEVPSSALLADRVLAACDFASIGTNDLTQYTLAADRLLGSVAAFQDPWHPAVLRLIREVGDAGRRARQAGRHLRRGRRRPAARRRARGPRRHEPVDGADGTRRRARLPRCGTALDDAEVIARAALAAEGAAEAREAAAGRRIRHQPRRAACRVVTTRRRHHMTTASPRHERPGRSTRRSPALRHVPVRHDHAEHRRASSRGASSPRSSSRPDSNADLATS